MNVRKLAPLTAAQHALVRGHVRLVEPVVGWLSKRYAGLLAMDEMIAIGREGLVHASQDYEPALGVPFGQYARYRIEGAILDAVRKEAGRMRAQVAGHAAMVGLLAVQVEHGDIMSDTDEDRRRRLDAMATKLAAAMLAGLVGEATQRAAATTEDDRVDHDRGRRAVHELESAKSRLHARDRRLLEMHYAEGKTLREVAGVFEVSYATARRWHEAVIERLARCLIARGVRGAAA